MSGVDTTWFARVANVDCVGGWENRCGRHFDCDCQRRTSGGFLYVRSFTSEERRTEADGPGLQERHVRQSSANFAHC